MKNILLMFISSMMVLISLNASGAPEFRLTDASAGLIEEVKKCTPPSHSCKPLNGKLESEIRISGLNNANSIQAAILVDGCKFSFSIDEIRIIEPNDLHRTEGKKSVARIYPKKPGSLKCGTTSISVSNFILLMNGIAGLEAEVLPNEHIVVAKDARVMIAVVRASKN